MSAIPFSKALRDRTWASHGESEHAGFMHDLMAGKGTREDYTALVVQHYYVYEALESAAATFADDPVAAPFLDPALTRLPALEADLAYLLGPGWRERIAPVPTTERYVARIREVEAQRWGGGYLAHHYTRYLGDLSGGQAVKRRMQQQFGFGDEGVGFYNFPGIPDLKAFKESYRARLDATDWDAAERERVIDEVVLAYRLNTEVFEDLSRAKAAAA